MLVVMQLFGCVCITRYLSSITRQLYIPGGKSPAYAAHVSDNEIDLGIQRSRVSSLGQAKQFQGVISQVVETHGNPPRNICKDVDGGTVRRATRTSSHLPATSAILDCGAALQALVIFSWLVLPVSLF